MIRVGFVGIGTFGWKLLQSVLRVSDEAGCKLVAVADATPAHIQFSFAGGLSILDSVTAEASQTGEASITLRGKTLTAARNVAVSL